jgi:hypothetical protein
MKKLCFNCLFLGECKKANLRMLLDEGGCGSFQPAPTYEISARISARQIAGRRALQQMLKKDPPKKDIGRRRNV